MFNHNTPFFASLSPLLFVDLVLLALQHAYPKADETSASARTERVEEAQARRAANLSKALVAVSRALESVLSTFASEDAMTAYERDLVALLYDASSYAAARARISAVRDSVDVSISAAVQEIMRLQGPAQTLDTQCRVAIRRVAAALLSLADPLSYLSAVAASAPSLAPLSFAAGTKSVLCFSADSATGSSATTAAGTSFLASAPANSEHSVAFAADFAAAAAPEATVRTRAPIALVLCPRAGVTVQLLAPAAPLTATVPATVPATGSATVSSSSPAALLTPAPLSPALAPARAPRRTASAAEAEALAAAAHLTQSSSCAAAAAAAPNAAAGNAAAAVMLLLLDVRRPLAPQLAVLRQRLAPFVCGALSASLPHSAAATAAAATTAAGTATTASASAYATAAAAAAAASSSAVPLVPAASAHTGASRTGNTGNAGFTGVPLVVVLGSATVAGPEAAAALSAADAAALSAFTAQLSPARAVPVLGWQPGAPAAALAAVDAALAALNCSSSSDADHSVTLTPSLAVATGAAAAAVAPVEGTHADGAATATATGVASASASSALSASELSVSTAGAPSLALAAALLGDAPVYCAPPAATPAALAAAALAALRASTLTRPAAVALTVVPASAATASASSASSSRSAAAALPADIEAAIAAAAAAAGAGPPVTASAAAASAAAAGAAGAPRLSGGGEQPYQLLDPFESHGGAGGNGGDRGSNTGRKGRSNRRAHRESATRRFGGHQNDGGDEYVDSEDEDGDALLLTAAAVGVRRRRAPALRAPLCGRAELVAAGAVLLFVAAWAGQMFSVQKLLVAKQYDQPFFVGYLSAAAAAPLALVWLSWARGNPTPGLLRRAAHIVRTAALLSPLSALCSWLWFSSLATTTLTVNASVVLSEPAWGAVFAALLLGRAPSRWALVAVAAAAVGVVTVVAGAPDAPWTLARRFIGAFTEPRAFTHRVALWGAALAALAAAFFALLQLSVDQTLGTNADLNERADYDALPLVRRNHGPTHGHGHGHDEHGHAHSGGNHRSARQPVPRNRAEAMRRGPIVDVDDDSSDNAALDLDYQAASARPSTVSASARPNASPATGARVGAPSMVRVRPPAALAGAAASAGNSGLSHNNGDDDDDDEHVAEESGASCDAELGLSPARRRARAAATLVWRLPAAALEVPAQEAAEALLFLGALGLCTALMLWPVMGLLHATGLETFQLPGRRELPLLLLACAADVLHNALVALATFVASPAAVAAGSLLIGPLCAVVDYAVYSLPVSGPVAAGYAALVVSFAALTFGDAYFPDGLDCLTLQ